MPKKKNPETPEAQSARFRAEVERLIADRRFAKFTSEFTSQWLALEKFGVLEPDRKQYPKLTRARQLLASGMQMDA